MKRSYAALVATVAALAPLGAGTLNAQIPSAQQMQQQQLQQMQQQMQRIDQTMQRMAQIQQRAQDMEQLMLQDMERVRLQENLHLEEGAQLQAQEQLRQQEQIRLMAHSVASAAGEMNQAMVSLRQMAEGSGDGALVQEMERLRLTMQETCNQMEAGLRIMDQLRDRLNQS
jgi:hypothetical protein